MRQSNRPAHQTRSERRRYCPGFHPRSARDFASQAQRHVLHSASGSQLRTRSHRTQTGVRRHLRTGTQRGGSFGSASLRPTPHEEQGIAGGRRARSYHRPHYPQIHAVKLRLLCERRSSHRHRRRPTKPHSLHPFGRYESRYLVVAPTSQGDGFALRPRHSPCRPRQHDRHLHFGRCRRCTGRRCMATVLHRASRPAHR